MASPTCRKTQTGRHEFTRMPYGTMVCVWCRQFKGTGTPIIEKRAWCATGGAEEGDYL